MGGNIALFRIWDGVILFTLIGSGDGAYVCWALLLARLLEKVPGKFTFSWTLWGRYVLVRQQVQQVGWPVVLCGTYYNFVLYPM